MAKAKKEKLSLDKLIEQSVVKDDEQPYEVPENWVWTRLGQVVSIKTGKEDANFASENGKYYFFSCAKEALRCNKSAFSGESIMVAGNGMFHVSYFNGEFNAYQRTYILQQFNAALGKYIYYHTVRAIDSITENNRGSTIQYIRLGDLTQSCFPLPPIEEQQRIVDLIESLFEKLDHAKELAQNALDSFENRKSAILQQAFTGELTKKWREENGVEMNIWEQLRFDEVAYIKSNLVDPKKTPNCPHIAPDNIEKRTGRLLAYRTIAEDGVTSGKHRFFAGQILYSKIRPYLSKVIIIDFDGLCSADMYPINAKQDTKYLW